MKDDFLTLREIGELTSELGAWATQYTIGRGHPDDPQALCVSVEFEGKIACFGGGLLPGLQGAVDYVRKKTGRPSLAKEAVELAKADKAHGEVGAIPLTRKARCGSCGGKTGLHVEGTLTFLKSWCTPNYEVAIVDGKYSKAEFSDLMSCADCGRKYILQKV